jgi:hypothetical protein
LAAKSGRTVCCRRSEIALAGQDVENDIGRVDAVGERFGAGRLNRRELFGVQI